MRGKTPEQPSMLALVSIESMVPADHPLRGIRPLVQRVLHELDPVFERMYTDWGRPSVPPERLLKAMLLMSLYSVRSERQFCEQLGYNMLFRWFLDMDLTERPFDASVFSKNRERLLEHDVARHFFDAILELDELRRHMSSDHFSVDGTLIEAWASAKSFRPKGEEESDNNGFADFKGTQRSNDTHESTTDHWRGPAGRPPRQHAVVEGIAIVEGKRHAGTLRRGRRPVPPRRDPQRRRGARRSAWRCGTSVSELVMLPSTPPSVSATGLTTCVRLPRTAFRPTPRVRGRQPVVPAPAPPGTPTDPAPGQRPEVVVVRARWSSSARPSRSRPARASRSHWVRPR